MPPASRAVSAVKPGERHHLKPLDGVRGLAILMVVLSHGFEANVDSSGVLVKAISALFFYGRFGVDLFFVLSGFLITGILVDTREDSHYFRRFLGRRALRILPLYYGVLFILILLTLPLHMHWNGMLPLLLTYTQNFRPFAIEKLAPIPSIGLFHFWSLAVEEQFYLVWPLVVFFVRSRRALLWVIALGSLSALVLRIGLLRMGVPWLVIHVITPTRADALLIGGALALALRSPFWPRLQRIAPFAFLLLLPLLFIPDSWLPGPLIGLRETPTALCFAALIAWSLRPASLIRPFMENKALRFLGKYSYGIYVIHAIVLTMFSPPLRAFLRSTTSNKLVAVAGSGLICLTLSVFLAYLSFNLYEKRFLRLKRHFEYDPVPPSEAASHPSLAVAAQ
jgi:peptidoglycan/LPS O-acetylase OafA/YrhL